MEHLGARHPNIVGTRAPHTLHASGAARHRCPRAAVPVKDGVVPYSANILRPAPPHIRQSGLERRVGPRAAIPVDERRNAGAFAVGAIGTAVSPNVISGAPPDAGQPRALSFKDDGPAAAVVAENDVALSFADHPNVVGAVAPDVMEHCGFGHPLLLWRPALAIPVEDRKSTRL